ncbi:alpha/beta fold hydrolase [Candidatus Dojkabacteria bacterium]|uniref:Leucine--tRNA ligase n=1 Tax=Candidatus Dojkabacteria bacterium TaxID=2099670 RepID=A0A3M0Z0R3_9BACT|nr:MAG: alpha/beta fold hydrolase [Candidatus Dojkabacteria bacterium]
MYKYKPKQIEQELLRRWRECNVYSTQNLNAGDKKYYSLYSFPYPSGSGLHVGHAEGMVANDIMARYYRMKGYKVLFPMGWDAFGLPAENYAIKTGTPPQQSTENAIKNFIYQIDRLGISVDWSKEIGTHRPDYYKWTQWIFLELFKKGKAYKKKAPVNWCIGCKTVLANEQVIDGKCERCDSEVVQKEMEQWFFRITDYADRLDSDLEKLDWPRGTKQQQKNWIGKSYGTRIKFNIVEINDVIPDQVIPQTNNSLLLKNIHSNGNDNLLSKSTKDGLKISVRETSETDLKEKEIVGCLEIFTTRIDTIFGATFCVVAPEHEILEALKNKIQNWDEVKRYISESTNKTSLERQTQKEKTGIEIKGLRALNPFSGDLIPIYVADYVLINYGTGAIMAVPAHDERDYEFAKRHQIPIRKVIQNDDKNEGEKDDELFTGYGRLINSREFSGLDSKTAIEKMQNWVIDKNLGRKETMFKIRDWLVSRQRYWGAPIPIIYSPKAEKEGYGYVPKDKLNVLFLHGFGSSGRKGWRIDFEKEMTKLGHKVYLPDLPNPLAPSFVEWENFIIENYLKAFDQNEKVVVVGHSLGGLLAFKLAEKFKLAKIIALAPATPKMDETVDDHLYTSESLNALKDFFNATKDLNVASISKNVDELIIINSKDDYVIKQKSQEFWKKLFKDIAMFVDFENMGHFNNQDLPNGFPELYAYINIKNNSPYPGIFPVNERDLPVLLPVDVNFKPTGESPIKLSKTFNQGVKCPIFGTDAFRESDTMDTFVDSSWYFLRYTDVSNQFAAFSMPKLLPRYNSPRNNEIWETAKEVAALLKDLNYAFFGPLAVSIINGGPYKQLSEIDVVASSHHLKSVIDSLIKNNYELITTEQKDSGYTKLRKNNVELTLRSISLEVTQELKFIEKYYDGVMLKVSTIEDLIEYCKEKNDNEALEMLESTYNQTNLWSPADIYMIGAEHTVLHLLYSRFLTKFLYDCGYINFSEPFTKMRHMGLILGSDRRKMSKRWNNVINPIDEIEKYSADTIRMYEMFMGPYEEAKPWNDRTENGVFRFLNRVAELSDKVSEDYESITQKQRVNELVKKITTDIESLSYNTAVAKFMEFSNFLQEEESISRDVWEKFLKLMAPFAPFLTDHLWNLLGNDNSIHLEKWPDYDGSISSVRDIKIVVQINGKVRGTLTLKNEASESELIELVKQNESISKYIKGEIKKSIYVKEKILSIVC